MTFMPRHILLRKSTSAAHDRLDRGVSEAGFFATVPLYGVYLQRLHALHHAFEAGLVADALPLARRYEVDCRSAWLASDLDDLGLRVLPIAQAPFGSAQRTWSTSGLFGCLYVMLGASLGARFLIRRAETLAIPEGRALTYLTRLSQSAHWPEFLKDLESAPVASLDDLVAGALATFESFHDQLLEPISI
jgi:heme oxygenase